MPFLLAVVIGSALFALGYYAGTMDARDERARGRR